MRVRIHYHTDCAWFAGCENMLANLLNDAESRREFDVSLSYRWSEDYADGLKRRTRLDFPIFPLHFPEPSTALPSAARLPRAARRGLRVVSRQVATYPLLVYEIWLLRRLFSRIAPDVVHINNGGYPAALSARAAAIAARMAGIRSVVMVVNNLAETRGKHLSMRRFVDRLVVGAVSQFVTGSLAASARLRGVLGLRDGESVAFPNGIALRTPSESRDETMQRLNLDQSSGVLFGVVALMEPRKGHRVLLEAVARLVLDRDKAPVFTVVVEGGGVLRDELEAYVRDSGLERYCRFIGSESNIMNLMAMIDVLVLPSISHEDFPNVILEAMGCSKAVIASRIAGTPEQVEDGVTGLLVPPSDPGALAVALGQVVVNAGLRERMGRAGRARFEKEFTARVAVSRYSELYHSLTKEHT